MAQHSANTDPAKGAVKRLLGQKPTPSQQKWLDRYACEVAVWSLCRVRDLTDVYDMMTNVGEAINGVYNRGCVEVEGVAGKWMERFLEDIDGRRQAFIEHIKTRHVNTSADYNALCKILIEWEGHNEGSPVRTKELVEELLAIDPARKGGEA